MTVDGEIELGEINLPATIAAVIGVPAQPANAAGPWPAEPFEPGLLPSLSGQIKVSVGPRAR